jgi:predicted transcriptional regulator
MPSADRTTGPVHIVQAREEADQIVGERRKDYIEMDRKLELVWTAISEIKKANNDLTLQIGKYIAKQDEIIVNHEQILSKLTEGIEKANKILNGNGVPGLVAKVDIAEKALKDIDADRKDKKTLLNGLLVSVAVLIISAAGQGAAWLFAHLKGF